MNTITISPLSIFVMIPIVYVIGHLVGFLTSSLFPKFRIGTVILFTMGLGVAYCVMFIVIGPILFGQ
jgi:hypothetical protein